MSVAEVERHRIAIGARKCGYCSAIGHNRRKCPKLRGCEKAHPDGRVCCKLVNHEGRCASVEGKWMISWKDEAPMSDATVPDVLKLNATCGRSPDLLASTMRDEFSAYICGWSDGAGAHAMRPEFISHATFATPYNEGYADGRKAWNHAHVAASEKCGHNVSVVRMLGTNTMVHNEQRSNS